MPENRGHGAALGTILWCAALLGAILAVLSNAHAAPTNGHCDLPPDVSGSRPGAGGAATPVQLGLFLIDVVEVDDRRQSFVANFNLNLRWTDPRLARPDVPGSICLVSLDAV